MGPDITNNKSGKSPYAFSKLMQTTILNILDVVNMMHSSSMFNNSKIMFREEQYET